MDEVKKKIIWKKIPLDRWIDIDNFTGDPTDIILYITQLTERYKEYSRLEFERSYDRDDPYFILCGLRPETEEEIKEREEAGRKAKLAAVKKKKQIEDQDRKEYLRLKKKYERG